MTIIINSPNTNNNNIYALRNFSGSKKQKHSVSDAIVLPDKIPVYSVHKDIAESVQFRKDVLNQLYQTNLKDKKGNKPLKFVIAFALGCFACLLLKSKK